MRKEIAEAICDRVLLGKPSGDFVEYVATRDWHNAVFQADTDNLQDFGLIMTWRIWYLPLLPAEINGVPHMVAEQQKEYAMSQLKELVS